jgi:hypothetical protein
MGKIAKEIQLDECSTVELQVSASSNVTVVAPKGLNR